MRSFAATEQTDIAAPKEVVFAHIVPVDLRTIFTGYGPLPAVTATKDQTGA
jgi:hypothetical protein